MKSACSAGNFAPAGWMFCEGQLLPISENETLFQLIGTTYGGDGQSTFALPEPARPRSDPPWARGRRHDLSAGETGGAETVTLTVQPDSGPHPSAPGVRRHRRRRTQSGQRHDGQTVRRAILVHRQMHPPRNMNAQVDHSGRRQPAARRTCSRTCASTSSSRCSGSSRVQT